MFEADRLQSLAMSLNSLVDYRGKVERSQLIDDIRHVVIKVTTNDNQSVKSCKG